MSFPSFRCAAYNNESRERSDWGVQATISDKRHSVCNEELGIAYFEAEVLTQSDYYPFGYTMLDRQWSAGAEGYRYGFNGMERDDETYGKGNALDFGARIYDSRLGRWLSFDPLQTKYASLSPYNFVGNSPMFFVDRDGRDYGIHIDHKTKTLIIKATYYVVEKDKEAAQNAANHWKDQNGNFVYEVDDGNGGKLQYSISFQLTVDASSSSFTEAQGKAYDDPMGNFYKEVSSQSEMFDTKDNDRGQTQYQREIAVNNSIARPETGAHELGHTLGAEHALVGLMKAGSSRGIGETQITEINVAQILNQVGLAIGDKERVLAETIPPENGSEKGNFKIISETENQPASFKTGTVKQVK